MTILNGFKRGKKMSRIIGLIDVNLECIKILEGDTRYYSFQVGKPFEYHDGPNESPIIIGIERKNDCYYLYAEGKHTFVAPANNYIAEYVEDKDA